MKKNNLQKEYLEVIEYFKTDDNVNLYWRTHSRREIDAFVQAQFGFSYFIFRRIIIEIFEFSDRTKEECDSINKRHREETNLKRYGRINVGQFGTDEHKQAMLTKYGVDNYFKTEEIKKLTHDRCFGSSLTAEQKQKISKTVKSNECQNKTKQTCMKKYGVEYSFQSKNNIEKSKQTFLRKYGIEHSPKNIYFMDNNYFDSLPEIALYMYAKEHNEPIIREPCKLEYTYNSKKYYCYPDFLYNNTLIEIKGPQFVKADGTWQNPFNHKLDDLSEAKHQCLLEHDVKILYASDYQIYLDWFQKMGYNKNNFLIKK